MMLGIFNVGWTGLHRGLGSWRIKMSPLIIHAKFSSKSKVVFFVGVFMPQMESKNNNIWRVARGLQDECSGF